MTTRLSSSDRELFSLVTEAAFANPFGERRQTLDGQISEGDPSVEDWATRMQERVGMRLEALRKAKLHLCNLSESDRELVEYTVLFAAFHRFSGQLDDLIEAQRKTSTPLRVSFADDFLASLASRGIAPERSLRMLELFHQVRRAYVFIKRGLVGRSACMRSLREELWRALFTHDIRRYERHLWSRMEDFSTIVVGETGTGKGAAAAALGMSGFIPYDVNKRAFAYSFGDSFLPINLNEFPETLFESEIFGHRKGAFTGAVDHYEGVLARCKPHGTVFFDEIGEATLPVQVKLLRVLQDRVYTPVGSRDVRRFSGRIVVATHRSLSELRASGAMRDDFFYRLSSNVIAVPPLRERVAEDASELAELVLHLCARITGAKDEALAVEVTGILERDLGARYAFPGNVRELEQCVRRVLLTGHCAPDIREAETDDLAAKFRQGAVGVEALVEAYCAQLYLRTQSYVEVARITGLDRRTVKKHVERHAGSDSRSGDDTGAR